MNKLYKSLQYMKKIFYLFVLLLAACTSNVQEQTAVAESASNENLLTLSEDQVQSLQILMGRPELRAMSSNIKASGMLDVPPNNMVTIAAPMGGFVEETHLLQGMHVKKGEVLVTLRHPDYIQLQEEYLQSKSQMDYMQLDLIRQEELARENINSTKTLQQARNEFKKTAAHTAGLAAKLKMINIQPASLEAEGIAEQIKILSPINGFVTQVHVNIGKYIAPQETMFKIVDNEHLHAELQVFEKDITQVQIGQNIHLRLVNETTDRLAKVYLIGKEISEDRTVRIHGHFEKHDPNLLPGMYFSAIIETGTEKLLSLPETAFAGFEGHDYVFVALGKGQYKLEPVIKGNCVSGNCVVTFTGEKPETEIVTRGAPTLIGILKNKGE
jgi:cobalt-zinc-cadmium efflux system membrane fusion protein